MARNTRDSLRKLIRLTTEIVYFSRLQFYYQAFKLLDQFTNELAECLRMLQEIQGEECIEYLGIEQLLNAQTVQDEILIADILEAQMLPVLEQAIQNLEINMPIDAIDYLEDNCEALECTDNFDLAKLMRQQVGVKGIVEYTASGDITMKSVTGGGYYVCGNNNPYKDALVFAESNIHEDKYRYVLLGSELLYDAEAFLKLRSDIELTIVEEDLDVLYCALRYRDVKDIILDERVHIIYAPYIDAIQNMDELRENLIIKKTAIRRMHNPKEKKRMEMLFLKTMTCKEQAGYMERNFRVNIKGEIHSIDELRTEMLDKTIYLVAGGPSLNKTVSILKHKKDGEVIICVGTVLEKLLQEKIVPDFVIITDPQETMCRQLECAEKPLNTRLLYMCSANEKAVRYFSGKKYIIFQKGFDQAEEYALRHGCTLFSTGGSVSTTALDIALRMGASQIVCLGLDLAYTGSQSHACGTLGVRTISQQQNMPMIQSVADQAIPTADNLMTYHHWIEERIRTVKGVALINISDGAFIKGMKNISTKDAMDAYTITD